MSVPARVEVRLTGEQLAAAVGISRAGLARLIRLGLAEPTAPGADEYTVATAIRLRRMFRLRGDLGVNWIGAAIIVDLVERLDRLYTEGRRMSPGE